MGVVVREESLFCLVFWRAARLRIGGLGSLKPVADRPSTAFSA